MLECSRDIIFVMIGVCDIWHSYETNYDPLIVNLFIIRMKQTLCIVLLKQNEHKLARSFSFTFRYIDDVLSLTNSELVIMLIASIQLNLK